MTQSFIDNDNKPRMSLFESIVFISVFILPFFFFVTSPEGTAYKVIYASSVAYLVLFISKYQYLRKTFSGESLTIIILYTVGLLFKYVIHESFSTMGFLMPIVGLFGYHYIDGKRIRLVVFDLLIIGLYIFFIYVFFTNLSGYLLRERLESEGNFFGTSSSNAIAIILVNVLYIYQVVAYLQKENRKVRFLLFSSINLVLILIQQSRAGIILALIFFIYNLYIVGKESKFILIRWLPIIVITVLLVLINNNADLVYSYLDQAEFGESAYSESRGYFAQLFFERMVSIEYFFAGYPQGTMWGNETYTFNVFLEHWNKYTLIGLSVTLFLLIRKFVSRKSFYFPWYFLLPFILYGMAEPRYLPNFWDFFIYLMLLKRTDSRVVV